MRNGQNKRMRGRNNHRKGQNPMTRVHESNGPDVKIRGTPSHIAEKYIQLARDAHTSGDPVSAENYYQHAEHYYRLIAVAQEQFRQNNPHFVRPENDVRDDDDDGSDEGGDEDTGQQPAIGASDTAYGTREPQPYLPPDAQLYPQQLQPQHPSHHNVPRSQPPSANEGGNVDRLPSFITGAQPQTNAAPGGFEGGNVGGGERFPRRRRRPNNGPRPEREAAPAASGDDLAPSE
jgi:hypothetical protein